MTRLVDKLRLLFRKPRQPQGAGSTLADLVGTADFLPARKLIRLGTSYGGWVIPADCGLGRDSICYLAGAGEDISFDVALVRRFGCRVRIVDPTPRAIEHFRQLGEAVSHGHRFSINRSISEFYDVSSEDLSRISFLPVGLSDRDTELPFYLPRNPEHVSCSTVNLQKTEDYFTAPCHRLATLMAQQGDSRIDLLKMDIEGAEYSVISDLLASGLLPHILLIEFDEAHTPLDSNASSRIRDHIQRLAAAGMRCVAVEGSNASFVRIAA